MSKNQTLLSFLVIGAIAVGGAYYYFQFLPNSSVGIEKQKQEVDTSLNDGKKLILKGQSSEAIPVLETSVKNSVDKSQESLTKINLGIAYMGSGMVEKGIDLLKEVSITSDYPSGYRSTAGQSVLEYYISGKDTDFALQHIFTGPTWGSFIKVKNPDAKALELGVVSAFEWVAALAPSFATEYTLASKYAALSAEATSTSERTKYATMASDHLKKGDYAYQLALQANARSLQQNPNTVPPYVDFRLGVGLEHKAITQSLLYEQKFPGLTLEQVESTYAAALAILEKDPTMKGSIVSGIYTRYHLAVLYTHLSATTYSQKILDTLTPLYNSAIQNTNFFQGFLKNYGSSAVYQKTPDWYDIVALSKVDPKFKSLLLSLGWKTTQLQ